MKYAPTAVDSISEDLHVGGWSYGYCAKIDETGNFMWIADAHKGDRWLKATGSDLPEALRKLREATQAKPLDAA